MLVKTDSEIEADANSEACLLESNSDSDTLTETDLEFNSDSDALAETDALDSDSLVKADAETLVDFEVNSDTETD